jgi:uncharacterized membrane protein (DUF4010 family)
MLMDQIKPFAVSFLIGLIIGIEREHSHPEGSQALGVRTFILLSLMGTLAAFLHQPMLDIVISIFVFGLIVAGYFRTTGRRELRKIQAKGELTGVGLTTEFTAGAVYCLGYIAFAEGFLATVIAVFVLLILITRKRLRVFSRRQISSQEIQAASILLVIGLGILPFLPNRLVDPWQLFNPHLFGLLFLAIASIQFGGYVAVRLMGERLGLVLTGFFGGLVSSTAIFLTVPKLVREDPAVCYPAIASSLAAVVASLLQFMVILFFVSPELLAHICWPILIMMAIAVLSSIILIREKHSTSFSPQTLNPLDLKAATRLSILLAGMIFVVGLTRKYLGINAFQIVNYLGGLFDTHSVTFAAASLFANNHLGLYGAEYALGLIIAASFSSKIFLLWFAARNRFAFLTTGILIVMLSAGASMLFTVY